MAGIEFDPVIIAELRRLEKLQPHIKQEQEPQLRLKNLETYTIEDAFSSGRYSAKIKV